jgi:hypothetical protein
MSEQKKSTEEQVERIEAIRGSEVLGYEGSGREEHSGENSPKKPGNLDDEFADTARHEEPKGGLTPAPTCLA